jgi:hypothetical protein
MNPFQNKCTTAVKNARVNSAFCFCWGTSFLDEKRSQHFVRKSDLLLHSEMIMWWRLRFLVTAQNMHVHKFQTHVSSCTGECRSKISKLRQFFPMLISWIQFYSKMCASLKFI